MPNEGDYLPPITDIPARPSTFVAPPPPPAFVAPTITIPAPPAASIPGQTMPPPPAASDNMVQPPEPAPQQRRRRRTQAEMLAARAPAAVQEPAPTAEQQQPVDSGDPGSWTEEDPRHPGPEPDNEAMPERNMASSRYQNPSWAEINAPRVPTIHVGLDTTANIGNYENIKYSVGVAGVPINATEAELMNIMAGANPRIDYIMNALGDQLLRRVMEVKEARGITD